MKRYRTIEVAEAEEGMQLFEDVVDRQGNMLIPAQTALTASLIRSLERRGIETVQVTDDSISAEELEAARAQAVARIDQLFAKSRGRASEELRQAVLAYRTEAL